tara:strand:- start:914 stop:1075 length:162 start_codon:yes stop_codon:yes gene_type:complete
MTKYKIIVPISEDECDAIRMGEEFTWHFKPEGIEDDLIDIEVQVVTEDVFCQD